MAGRRTSEGAIQLGGAGWGVRVVVDPGLTVALADLPPYSLALDGVVQGPELDLDGHRFSFDHHGNCLRLVTSATCRQVADALLLGLDPAAYTVYVNDVDADTALAVALLAHPSWLGAAAAERGVVRRLVEAVGGRDAHGPAYPVAEPALLEAFATGVPLPRRRSATPSPATTATTATATGATVATTATADAGAAPPAAAAAAAEMMAADLAACVAAVARLVRRLAGTATSQDPDHGPDPDPDPDRDSDPDPDPDGDNGETASVVLARAEASFTVTHVGTGWVMAVSDTDAFDRLYEAGHLRGVMWRPLDDGTTSYTVGRRSDLVDGFPVGPADQPGTVLAALAAREFGWGGGSSIGGAPRHPDGRRSRLTPDEVFAVVEAVVTSVPAVPSPSLAFPEPQVTSP